MSYEYGTAAIATKPLCARNLSGLPNAIKLAFNKMYIRFYKSREMPGYFYCKLAIPMKINEEKMCY